MNAPWTTAAPASPQQAALQRLAETRGRLGRACGHAPGAGAGDPAWPPSSAGPLAQLASRGAIALLAERWRRSPWRLSLQLADQTAHTLLRPLAQRHPVGLVLVAGAVGGLVTLVRPWRWLPATRLLALWPLAGRALARAALQGAAEQWPNPDPPSARRTP